MLLSTAEVRIRRSETFCETSERSFEGESHAQDAIRFKLDSVIFWRIEKHCTKPAVCLSSGTIANPLNILSVVTRESMRFPERDMPPCTSRRRPIRHSR